MHSPITKQNKSMEAINGDTIKYFYLYRFIYAADICWVTACSTAKACKGNGRCGPAGQEFTIELGTQGIYT